MPPTSLTRALCQKLTQSPLFAGGLQRIVLDHRTRPLPEAEWEHWNVCLRTIEKIN
jgi:hypothetical protein